MANEDLKKKLEVLEIRYPANASRKQLEALLEEASALPDPDPVEYAGAEPAVESEAAPEPPAKPLPYVKTNTPGNKLNVRAEPQGEVLDTIEHGTLLGIAGEVEDGWLPVIFEDEKAYVMARFVVANG